MYIDYFPVEAIAPITPCVTFEDDVIEIRQAKHLTPIRDLLPLDKPKIKSRPRCHLHKGIIDENHAHCKYCGAAYCLPCARQLIELDEPCWLCGQPMALELIVTTVPMCVEE